HPDRAAIDHRELAAVARHSHGLRTAEVDFRTGRESELGGVQLQLPVVANHRQPSRLGCGDGQRPPLAYRLRLTAAAVPNHDVAIAVENADAVGAGPETHRGGGAEVGRLLLPAVGAVDD